jgi:mono/diheme cytochrome c family protein
VKHTQGIFYTTRFCIFYLQLFGGSGVLHCNRQKRIIKIMKNLAFIFGAVIGINFSVLADNTNLPPAATKTGVTYATDIKPIFDASCVKCHDSKKPKQSAKLSLDTLDGILKGDRDGKVITPGDSAHSDLVMSVAHVGDPDTFMPKGKDAHKLTDDQIGLIRAWIDQGAK